MRYTPVSVSISTSANAATNDSEVPSRGYLSLATPIRPCPARAAPGEDHLLPRHAHHLGGHALAVAERFGAEVADAGLDVHPAVRLDDEQAVEADRARVVRADRDAAAAHPRAVAHAAARLALVPLEHLRALVERFLDEAAGRVRPVAARVRRAELRLARRRVDLADLDLIDTELACRPGHERFHQDDALHPARLALRAARRRVGDRRHAAPPHRLGLVQE